MTGVQFHFALSKLDNNQDLIERRTHNHLMSRVVLKGTVDWQLPAFNGIWPATGFHHAACPDAMVRKATMHSVMERNCSMMSIPAAVTLTPPFDA
jgi:hypothetical protein